MPIHCARLGTSFLAVADVLAQPRDFCFRAAAQISTDKHSTRRASRAAQRRLWPTLHEKPARYKNNNTTANPRSEDPSPAIRPLNAPAPAAATRAAHNCPKPSAQTPPAPAQREAGLGLARRRLARLRRQPATPQEPGPALGGIARHTISHEPPRRQEGQGEDRRRRF